MGYFSNKTCEILDKKYGEAKLMMIRFITEVDNQYLIEDLVRAPFFTIKAIYNQKKQELEDYNVYKTMG